MTSSATRARDEIAMDDEDRAAARKTVSQKFRASLLDRRLLASCVVYEYYGVRFIAAADLPPSPYQCPRCDAPFWSPAAKCHGRGHPSTRVIERQLQRAPRLP